MDYILPESTQKGETSIGIPQAIVDLVSAYLYFIVLQKNDGNTIEINVPSSDINITYFDIGGEKHASYFHLKFSLRYISSERIGFSLDPEKAR